MTDLIVLSFGYLHHPAPAADLTLDVREYLRDPRTDAAFGELTGHDERVRDQVLGARGTVGLTTALYNLAEALAVTRRHPDRSVTIAIGCAGGRHRSVVLVNELTVRLARACWRVEAHRRDITQPVVNPPASDDPR